MGSRQHLQVRAVPTDGKEGHQVSGRLLTSTAVPWLPSACRTGMALHYGGRAEESFNTGYLR